MSGFSKAIESILKSFSKQASKEISQNASKQGLKSSTPAQKQIHKEQRGIYNVTYNGKNATMIYKDRINRQCHSLHNNIPKKEASGYNSRLPAASEEIITFYSNRNLPKDKVFEFKNPKLQESNNLKPQTKGEILQEITPFTRE